MFGNILIDKFRCYIPLKGRAIEKAPMLKNYVEDILRDKLDTKVKIKDKKIEISFTNTADLNRILEILDMKEM